MTENAIQPSEAQIDTVSSSQPDFRDAVSPVTLPIRSPIDYAMESSIPKSAAEDNRGSNLDVLGMQGEEFNE